MKNQFENNNNFLLNKAKKLSEETNIGGPVKDFENVGRLQLITLLKVGLYPHSKVLDIGCGCLRGGYWLIHFLNANCYFGIEPNKKMLNSGIKCFLNNELIRLKKPQFKYNSDFDLSVFNIKFDFVIARSIWTHASKDKIEIMLTSFYDNSKQHGVFLASYHKTDLFHFEYEGEDWIGRSHISNMSGMISHSFRWIKKICNKKGLIVKEMPFDVYNNQYWLYIIKK